ncbi:MAG: hypothetical protein IJ446_07280 [Oscillospiraceae bacterium]|nr:hypothetical protein [Oscillospiraceae bacterium]
MTTKKTLSSRVTAFAAAFALFMTLLFVYPDGTFRVNAVDNPFGSGTLHNASGMMTFKDNTVMLNGTELTANQEIRNGDMLSYELDWSLDDVHNVVAGDVFYYDLSGQLNGIKLNNEVVPTTNAVYAIKDNVLFIQLLEVGQGKSGTFMLEGKLDVTKDDVGDKGEFVLKFFDEVPVIIADYKPGLTVSKYRTNGEIYEKNGKYYQDFTIELNSNGGDSAGVKITDAGGALYDFSGMTDVTVTVTDKSDGWKQSAGSYNSLNNSADGFVLDYGTVKENHKVEIKYSVPVDLDGYIELRKNTDGADQNAKINKVTAVSSNGGTVEDTEETYLTLPSVEKSGTYNETEGTVSWTIKVRSTELFKDKDFTLTEIPVNETLTEAQIKEALGGSLTIDKSAMTFDAASNTYSYTFSTKVTEAQKGAITNTNVRNKAKLEYDGGWTDEAETEVTVPGSYKGISKTHAENQDGSVTWTITVPVPASGAEKITVRDWFDIEPYDYTARENINKSLTVAGMTFTVDGVNYPDAAVKEWDNDGSGMQFYFKSEFLADVKGKDIVITYTTPEELLTDNIIRVTNNTIVYIDDITVPQVSDTYLNADPAQYKGEKTVLNSENYTWLKDGNYRMPMIWSIKLDEGKISAGMRQFSSGDIITIKDTIPEGLVLIDGKYMMNCLNNINQDEATQYVNQGCFAVSQNGNVVTFTITVNDYLEEKLHQWDGDVPLYVFYGT